MEQTREKKKHRISYKLNGLEFDIRQTNDKIIVVSHNHKVTKLDKKIEELNFNEIQKSTNITTFTKVIQLAKKYKISIWVEIKDSHLYPDIIDDMLEVLRKEKYSKHTIVQSFNLDDLKYIDEKDKYIKLLKLYLFHYDYNNLPNYIDYIGLPIISGIINYCLINNINTSEHKTIFWRESSLFENKYMINKLIEAGADGFMLDKSLNEFLQ